MSFPTFFTRREALKTAALGAMTLPFWSARSAVAASAAEPAGTLGAPPTEGWEKGLRLGVATYSTRDLSVDETIKALKVLRIVNASLFRAHMPWAGTAEECRVVARKFHDAGIAITGSGVINLPNNEGRLRHIFDNAKAAGLVTMMCSPEVAALPLVEKFARDYDQKLAIHNHGPEDKTYPTPRSAFDLIKTLDARIGLCIDVGHTMRAGSDPVADIGRFASRVYDIHLKDSVAVVGAMKDVPVEVGAGRIDIRGILRALLRIKYRGVVAFEYEKVAANPVTGLAESIGYVRGMLAALAR